MYINKKKLSVLSWIWKIQTIISIIFLAFLGIGIVDGLLEPMSELRSYLPLYVILALPFAILLWAGHRAKNQVEVARQLDRCFCADADGNLSASQLMAVTGSKNEFQTIQTVNKLIGKGYLINCAVEQAPVSRVVLYHMTSSGTGHIALTCPQCGASVDGRIGFSCTCPYCNSVINTR